MPAYILLMKYTDKGLKDIKNAPARIDEAFKTWESMGGKVLSYYLLLGEYDCMAIGEGPSDEAAVAFALAIGAQGNVTTKTLKGFSKEEVAEIVKKIP